MPLRCSGPNGSINAWELSDEEWAALRADKRGRGITMPCCGQAAFPRVSPLGTRHFAHHRRGGCDAPSESREHIFCKTIIAKAAAEAGWAVETESRGQTPDGEVWVADVLCRKGVAAVAVEVQLSSQDRSDMLRRQRKYVASGVRGCWLAQPPRTFYGEGVRATKQFPIFYIHVKGDEARVSTPAGAFSLERFTGDLLSRRIRWKEPRFLKPHEALRITRRQCWRCKTWRNSVVSWCSDYGATPIPNWCVVAEATSEQGDMLIRSASQMKSRWKLDVLGFRYSRTIQQRYLAPICEGCGAFCGKHFLEELARIAWAQDALDAWAVDVETGDKLPDTSAWRGSWTHRPSTEPIGSGHGASQE